jgi:hypothetical protein
VTFGQGVNFNGEVYIAADNAALFPGKLFSMTFTDGPDADTEAVRAALTFQTESLLVSSSIPTKWR